MINQLSQEIHKNAKQKGFYDEPKNTGEMLCLIHSEVSEALEADRKNNYARDFEERINQITESYNGNITQEIKDADFKMVFADRIKNTFEDELADIMIRVMDLAGFKNIDLEKHIALKMKYNSFREHKHGKKY